MAAIFVLLGLAAIVGLFFFLAWAGSINADHHIDHDEYCACPPCIRSKKHRKK